jgi:hypothetical protein
VSSLDTTARLVDFGDADRRGLLRLLLLLLALLDADCSRVERLLLFVVGLGLRFVFLLP